MTTIDKKYSKDNDPEVPKDRIIDALRAGNKLSAAMATDIDGFSLLSKQIICGVFGDPNLFFTPLGSSGS